MSSRQVDSASESEGGSASGPRGDLDGGRDASARPTVSLAPPPGRPEAADAIWSFRPPAAARECRNPASGSSRARLRGLLQALAAAAGGAVLLFFSLRTPAFVAFALAGVVGVSALVAPTSLYAGLERVVLALGKWTGRVLGWVLLVPVFYLFFAPFGRLFRRGRRDRLQRWLERDAASYWERHEGLRAASDSPRRQY
jgi:hypothetical protein